MDALYGFLAAAGAMLLGAAPVLLGAAIALVGPYWQTRTAAKTERMKQIVQLAIEDHKSALEQGRHQTKQDGTFYVVPLAVKLQYHAAVLDAIERGELTPAKFQQIRATNYELAKLTQSEPGGV